MNIHKKEEHQLGAQYMPFFSDQQWHPLKVLASNLTESTSSNEDSLLKNQPKTSLETSFFALATARLLINKL